MRSIACLNYCVFSLALLALVSGCNTTLSGVQNELAKGGYMLWYPARVGVEPGQIWLIDGSQKVPFLDRPSQVAMSSSSAQFESLTKEIDATASLNANFTTKVGGDADALKIALSKGTVTNIALDFGDTVIDDTQLGALVNNLTQYPQNYQQAIKEIQVGSSDKVLIASIVRASGMTYTFTCTDTRACCN
ncbi:MAG TPA: hypothetical protein VFC78_12895 [Tepidisphaeraceae bacterium]|nr:hypothetical protein [Tepidisphaeraceae bacterium]